MTSNPPLELAYRYAQFTGRNIFLTGKAGTGKTTFLRRLKETTYKRMIVVAPTGVAAINAGGVTIHSFFQLAPGLFLPNQHKNGREGGRQYAYSKHKINILRSIDLLVIDEISMVRADLLDAIDDVLRRFQDRTRPFGGVQLLMIGDLQQLAPVTKDDEWELLKDFYPTPYFFDSLALKQTHYTTIELTQVFRQADEAFLRLLNQVRDGHPDAETLRLLNERYNPHFTPRDEEGYITLTTHNYQAQELNQQRLEALPGKAVRYTAKVEGDFPKMAFPTDEELTLKVGAQVMFCKNDPSMEKAYYNGKIGRIVELNRETAVVECIAQDGKGRTRITVGAQEWQNTKYVTNEQTGIITEEVSGRFVQMPLKTAWAITIHKSQGLTFDHAIINAGRAFSYGQVYVALSRCRTLHGLVLSTPITPQTITTDPDVLRYNQFIEQNQPNESELANDERSCVEDLLGSMFDFTPLEMRLRYLVRLAQEHLEQYYPRFTALLEEKALAVEHELKEVGLRFRAQIHQLMPLAPDYEHNEKLQGRVDKAVGYYTCKTAEILGDLFVSGLPEVGNKQTAEQLAREFELLKEAYDLKMALFLKCAHGFSLKDYWDAKAQVKMQQGDEKPTKKTASKGKKSSESLTGDIPNPKLYDRLRNWRNETAAEHEVPPYTVLSNKALLGIVRSMPRNESELLEVSGVGKKVVANYGKTLLELVQQER
jgi:hypothetical protein